MRLSTLDAEFLPPHIRVLIDKLRRYRSLLQNVTNPEHLTKIRIRILQIEELLRLLGYEQDESLGYRRRRPKRPGPVPYVYSRVQRANFLPCSSLSDFD